MERVHFSKRVHYLILLFITLLNIIIRYPITPHEIGIDSFYIHMLGNSITENGYATWAIHLLSYFGMFPESYPIAIPYLISGFSQLSGLPMEATIYAVSLFFGILSIFTGYILAGEIMNDDRFRFLVAISLSTSPIIVKFSSWTMSTRGLFLTLSPIFLYLLYRSETVDKIQQIFYYMLTFLLLVVMATIHRMFWILFILWLLFYIVNILHNVGHNRAFLQFSLNKKRLSWVTPIAVSISLYTLFLLLFIIKDIDFFLSRLLPTIPFKEIIIDIKSVLFFLLMVMVFTMFLFWILGTRNAILRLIVAFALSLISISMFLIQFTSLAPWQDLYWLNTIVPTQFKGETVMDMMIGLFIVMGARIGIFLIICFFGFFTSIWAGKPDRKKMFTLISIVSLAPFFHIAMYFYQILTVFYYILGSILLLQIIWFFSQIKKPKLRVWKSVGIVIVTIILLSSVIFTTYTLGYRISNVEGGGQRNYMTEPEYNTGVYLRYRGGDKSFNSASNRVGAIMGAGIEVNKSNIEVARQKLPDTADFYGWYTYFQFPLKTYIYAEKEREGYKVIDGQSGWDSDEQPCRLFDNGRMGVEYRI